MLSTQHACLCLLIFLFGFSAVAQHHPSHREFDPLGVIQSEDEKAMEEDLHQEQQSRKELRKQQMQQEREEIPYEVELGVEDSLQLLQEDVAGSSGEGLREVAHRKIDHLSLSAEEIYETYKNIEDPVEFEAKVQAHRVAMGKMPHHPLRKQTVHFSEKNSILRALQHHPSHRHWIFPQDVPILEYVTSVEFEPYRAHMQHMVEALHTDHEQEEMRKKKKEQQKGSKKTRDIKEEEEQEDVDALTTTRHKGHHGFLDSFWINITFSGENPYFSNSQLWRVFDAEEAVQHRGHHDNRRVDVRKHGHEEISSGIQWTEEGKEQRASGGRHSFFDLFEVDSDRIPYKEKMKFHEDFLKNQEIMHQQKRKNSKSNHQHLHEGVHWIDVYGHEMMQVFQMEFSSYTQLHHQDYEPGVHEITRHDEQQRRKEKKKKAEEELAEGGSEDPNRHMAHPSTLGEEANHEDLRPARGHHLDAFEVSNEEL